MPRPDRLWLVLLAGVLAVAVGGCKSQPKARLGPSEAPVYSVRDPDNVRRQVRLQDLLALAARDMQVGNLDAAERKAREALKLAPESPDALVLMAGIDERRGRTQQAGESFRRAAERAPQRGDVLNNYGAWLCQQGRPAESLAWFDR
ncbi:tetratricopeptide repeat protein, partial [Stenotrophomonas geniculata]